MAYCYLRAWPTRLELWHELCLEMTWKDMEFSDIVWLNVDRCRDLHIFQTFDLMCNTQCIDLLLLLYKHFELELNKDMAAGWLDWYHDDSRLNTQV